MIQALVSTSAAQRKSDKISLRLPALVGAAILLIGLILMVWLVGVPADPPEVNLMMIGP